MTYVTNPVELCHLIDMSILIAPNWKVGQVGTCLIIVLLFLILGGSWVNSSSSSSSFFYSLFTYVL